MSDAGAYMLEFVTRSLSSSHKESNNIGDIGDIGAIEYSSQLNRRTSNILQTLN